MVVPGGSDGNLGGVFYRATGDAGWTKVVGYGETITDRDCQSIAVHGDALYVGTRGADSHHGDGTLLYCADALNSPTSWARLANNSASDLCIIGTDATDYYMTENISADTVIRAERMTKIISLAVDRKGWVWYGVGVYAGKYAGNIGVYLYDGSGFHHISEYTDSILGRGPGYAMFYDTGNDRLYVSIECGIGTINPAAVPGWLEEDDDIQSTTGLD